MKTIHFCDIVLMILFLMHITFTIDAVQKLRINGGNNQPKKYLDKSSIKFLLKYTEFDEKLFRSILEKILIPRSINSPGHKQVRKYIKTTLQQLDSNWHVEEDVFRTETPAGPVKFRNIIATYVPDFGCMPNRLRLNRTILACHYDSLYSSLAIDSTASNSIEKLFNEQSKRRRRKRPNHLTTSSSSINDSTNKKFTGATDAAVSCSLMLYLAQSMNNHLEAIWNHNVENNREYVNTLQLVFFDGEEMIQPPASSSTTNQLSAPSFSLSLNNSLRMKRSKKWTKNVTDSLYGSRHLARKWARNSRTMRRSSRKKKKTKRNYQKLFNYNLQLNDSVGITTTNTSKPIKNNRQKRDKRTNNRRILFCDQRIGMKLAKMADTNKNIDTFIVQNNNNNNGMEEIFEILSPKLYNTIDDIRLFILLDLIGGTNNRFYNTNMDSANYFQQLLHIEKLLLELLNGQNKKSSKAELQRPFFQDSPPFMISLVRDDHLPFLAKNVSILHLIPHPFPRYWHTIEDNIDHLKFNTIGRMATLLQLFLYNLFYMP